MAEFISLGEQPPYPSFVYEHPETHFSPQDRVQDQILADKEEARAWVDNYVIGQLVLKGYTPEEARGILDRVIAFGKARDEEEANYSCISE